MEMSDCYRCSAMMGSTGAGIQQRYSERAPSQTCPGQRLLQDMRLSMWLPLLAGLHLSGSLKALLTSCRCIIRQPTISLMPTLMLHLLRCMACLGLRRVEDAGTMLQVSKAGDLEHGANICQIDWNASGTWLAVATSDGRLSLWRQNLLGSWKLVSTTEAVIPGGCIMVD